MNGIDVFSRARVLKLTQGLLCVATSLVTLLAAPAAMAGRSPASEAIQFPDEELASESVLPVFDHPVSVKSRSVLLQKRFEVGAMAGMSLMEPFYNPMNFALTGSYHFDEITAINVTGYYYMQGLSNNAEQLNPIPNTSTFVNLQYAPSPKYLVLADYQYTGFYGKISIGKDFIMNLSLYGLLGGGLMGVGDVIKPALNFGLGQKFYFSPSFALRFDFRFVAYQGPDVLSRRLDTVSSAQPASRFGEKINYQSLLSLGAVFLFPGM